MSDAKFSKLLDYDAIKQQFGDAEDSATSSPVESQALPEFGPKTAYLVTPIKSRKTGLTGSRLRSYAFAVLTRKEYSKAELIENWRFMQKIVMKWSLWLRNYQRKLSERPACC